MQLSWKRHKRTRNTVLNDVKALYPSLKFENTGKINRKRIEKSEIEFNGFSNKKGLAYICMNKKLTTELDDIEYMLPKRKSLLNTDLKMSAITTSWDPEERFNYPQQEYTKAENKLIIARVVEIATRTLFENHMYRFAGEVYKQESGGSIGDRWTGSAAEIVMQDWADQYMASLENSGLEVPLLAGYVDDGRQGTTILPKGQKFNKDKNQFIHCQEQEAIDKKLMMEGESRNQRMARITVEAMNSINIDLEFTVECEEEFSNERLHTLDFAIWQEKDGQITHS